MATSYNAATHVHTPTGETNYAALTVQMWDKIVHAETQNQIFFQREGLIAEDKDELKNLIKPPSFAPIMKKTQLGKGHGDTIHMGLAKALSVSSSAGKTGVNTLKDNEQSLTLYDMAVYIDLWRQGIKITGTMAEQRRPFAKSLSGVAVSVLRAWMTQTIDFDMFYALYNGFSVHVVAEYTNVSAVTHPNIKYAGDASSDAGLDSADLFNTTVIERMSAWARANNIQPITSDGFEGYVIVVHPYQTKTLREDSIWREAQQNANIRGSKNPIFNGPATLGKYADIVVKESNRIEAVGTTGDNAKKRKALLLGGHAMAYAIGREAWLAPREDKDYGIIDGWAVNTIWGNARADWVSDDGNSTKLNQSSAEIHTWAEDPS